MSKPMHHKVHREEKLQQAFAREYESLQNKIVIEKKILKLKARF